MSLASFKLDSPFKTKRAILDIAKPFGRWRHYINSANHWSWNEIIKLNYAEREEKKKREAGEKNSFIKGLDV